MVVRECMFFIVSVSVYWENIHQSLEFPVSEIYLCIYMEEETETKEKNEKKIKNTKQFASVCLWVNFRTSNWNQEIRYFREFGFFLFFIFKNPNETIEVKNEFGESARKQPIKYTEMQFWTWFYL